jgi:hypothetical protein
MGASLCIAQLGYPCSRELLDFSFASPGLGLPISGGDASFRSPDDFFPEPIG